MRLLLALMLQATAPAAAPAATTPAFVPVTPMATAIITSERAAPDPAPASPLAAMAEAADDKPEAAAAKPTPQQRTEKVRRVVVRAIRNCPEAKTPDDIIVCSKDRGVAEAYRIPKLDPRYEKREPAIALGGSVGSGQSLGTGDCSAVGALGQTGCSLGAANSWGAERKAAGKKWGEKN